MCNRLKIIKFENSSAVDFVAFRQDALYLFEVKDMRGYPVNNRQRITSGELALEIAINVRDSIAGIVGARQMSSNPDEWKLFSAALNRDRAIKVVLWLEEDLRLPPNYASTLAESIKKHLKWLTKSVLVESIGSKALSDLTVKYRAGGVRPR